MRLIKWLREDYVRRTILFAMGSSFTSALMAAYYCILAALSFSVWYTTLAAYYGVLILMRGALLISRMRGRQKREKARERALRDAKGYLAAGILLCLLSFVFSGILALTVVKNYYHAYAGLTIYVAALYATIKMVFGIMNFLKAQKYEDLTVRALRNINIADALVSVVALQAAMLQTFPDGTIYPPTFNAVTGGIAGALILALGTYMAFRGLRYLKHRGH